jgi:hypothetical protein
MENQTENHQRGQGKSHGVSKQLMPNQGRLVTDPNTHRIEEQGFCLNLLHIQSDSSHGQGVCFIFFALEVEF